jgi:hypothetical protein
MYTRRTCKSKRIEYYNSKHTVVINHGDNLRDKLLYQISCLYNVVCLLFFHEVMYSLRSKLVKKKNRGSSSKDRVVINHEGTLRYNCCTTSIPEGVLYQIICLLVLTRTQSVVDWLPNYVVLNLF